MTSLFEPLYTISHVSSGAKIVDFHGYELPIWYSSIQEEHLATRSSAGLFDVSHMGFFDSKEGSEVMAEFSIYSRVYEVPARRCGYTHFLDHDGRIIDDMIFAVSSESEVLRSAQFYDGGHNVPVAFRPTSFQWIGQYHGYVR